MATLNLPDQLKPILEKIATISDAEFRKIESTIASISPSLDPVTTVSDIDYVPDVVRAMVNLNMARGDISVPTEQFAKDVTKAIKKKKNLPKQFSEKVFLERIHKLLSIESIVFSSRAIDVQHAHDAFFISSRIFSDLRPVFNAKGSKPLGALIIHNLKIIYHQNNEHKELFLTVDNDDLTALRKILDRAEAKTIGMEVLIKKTGLKYFKGKR